MEKPPDEHQPNDFWQELKRYYEPRKHLLSAQELEILNDIDNLVPFSQVLAEIQKEFGAE